MRLALAAREGYTRTSTANMRPGYRITSAESQFALVRDVVRAGRFALRRSTARANRADWTVDCDYRPAGKPVGGGARWRKPDCDAECENSAGVENSVFAVPAVARHV